MFSYKRQPDRDVNNAAADIVPLPAANTSAGAIVDAELAADTAKRRRTDIHPDINDAQCARALQISHDTKCIAGPVGAAIVGIEARLRQLDQLVALVGHIDASVGNLDASVGRLDARVGRLANLADPVRQAALARNLRAATEASVLANVPRVEDLALAPNFPATIADFLAMNGAGCNALLAHYGLPADGTVVERRWRLGDHLGIL